MKRHTRDQIGPGVGELTVLVDTDSVKDIKANIVDVSSEGLLIVLSVGGPVLEAGQEVNLWFEHTEPDALPGVRATLRHCLDESDACIYGLELIDKEQLEGSLPPALIKLFERRS